MEESYFNKCFRRKTQKKRNIDQYCYLRARYVSPCEEISWKRRYASAELSKASIICHSARFGQQNILCVWMQPPVAHNSRPLRRRQPSKTGIHAIQNPVEKKFPLFQFLIFCSLRSRSNKDAKDSQADLNFLRRSVEA